jgi:hypothetical protein
VRAIELAGADFSFRFADLLVKRDAATYFRSARERSQGPRLRGDT